MSTKIENALLGLAKALVIEYSDADISIGKAIELGLREVGVSDDLSEELVDILEGLYIEGVVWKKR